jgi:hypothetical protein
MKRYLSLALALAFGGLWALTHAHEVRAQSGGNPSCAWGCVYKPPSANEMFERHNRALTEHQLGKGGGVGGGNGGTVIHGDMVTNYLGPVSDSGSTVINTVNHNQTTTSVDANNSQVQVHNQTGQTANNATQSGAANANSATGNNATQSGSANNNP